MLHDDDGKPFKKPVPLPRKSLLKINNKKVIENEIGDKAISEKKTESKQFIRDDWRSASESFVHEKKRQMKNEVNKLEKSVKSIISRRKSSYIKSTSDKPDEKCRSDSLPDGSVFFNISFNSPLEVTGDCDEIGVGEDQSPSCHDDNDFYKDKSLSPPAYPPPDPPDESLYDQMKSFDFSDAIISKFTGNEYTCDYSTTSSSKLYGSECLDSVKSDNSENNNFAHGVVSASYYDGDDDISTKDDRYQIIYDSVNDNESKDRYTYLEGVPHINKAKQFEWSATKDKNLSKNDNKVDDDSHKKIICMFDPLGYPKLSNDSVAKSSESFSAFLNSDKSVISSNQINSVPMFLPSVVKDSNIIPPNMKEGHYGKIKKVSQTLTEPLSIFPKNALVEPPPIPPRHNLKPFLKIDSPKPDKKLSEPQPEPCSMSKNETPFNETSLPNEGPEEKIKPPEVIQWSSLKRVAKKVADNLEHRTSYLSLTGRKSLKPVPSEEQPGKLKTSYNVGDICTLPQNFPKHSGIMYRPGGIERWGVLSQRKLTLFANKDSPDVKETVPMDNILSIQATQNKISNETIGIHCFEISLSSRNQLLLFGVPSISERHIWMRKLIESIGPGFSAKLSMDYSKAGWCYAKESISCDWAKHCILLHHRTLYLSSELGSISEFNLRKARNISLKTEGFTCGSVTEKGPQILVDLQGKTLYLQMDNERETKAWELTLLDAALKNGPSLCEQQLTKDNVPAIVDKCLNFVHTHGCFSEGIYRRSGSNRTVNQLLARFRFNAWSIQLNREECTEFDVASVLKRFFRDLPEPLLVPELQEELSKILGLKDVAEKINEYKTVLKKLPLINYLTARRLLGHLYFIDKQKEKNLMGAENLAAIWGPTILQVQEQVSLDSDCFKVETLIVHDLICNYPEIFSVANAEVEREMKILQLLESYHVNSNNTLTKKPSGELKIWVYLITPNNSDNCFNISINPQKTAEEVCKELSLKANLAFHSSCLEEVICSGHLTRPLNHSEKVLDTVLRWSYWDEADRKDNCLVLKKNDFFQQVVQYGKYPVIVSEELKYADQKTKTFKPCQFEFSQAKLICYKDKMCSQKINEWRVEDIVWYFGHEPKRSPHSKWSITFFERASISPRTKEKPYFGNTICGSSEEQKLKLATALLMAQYSKDILPTPNLME